MSVRPAGQDAMCQDCGHDLGIRLAKAESVSGWTCDGSVYCTNSECRFFGAPHPTKAEINGPVEYA